MWHNQATASIPGGWLLALLPLLALSAPLPKTDDFSLRHLLDAPAGKHGFVRISPEDKRLYFADGSKARFHGVCFKDYFNTWDREITDGEMDRLLDGLTVMGVNMIRNQTTQRKLYDFGEKRFRPTAIDNFDRFFHKMKQRGIYLHLNLNVGSGGTEKWPKQGDAYKRDKKYGLSRANLVMNDCFIEPQKIFATELLNHKNPYTNLAYKDEPGIISLQLGNEQHSYSRPPWRQWEKMKGPYREEIETAWNLFLKKKYQEQTALQQAWGTELKTGEDLDSGTIRLSNPRYARWNDPREPTPREHDAVLFGNQMQRRFHDIMRQTIREIAGDSHHYISDNGWIRGDPLICKTAHEKLDINDLQHYWPHGSRKRSEKGYRLSPSRDAAPAIVRSLLTARECEGVKKPFYVTEFNSHADNQYAWEIFPLHTLLLTLAGGDGQSVWLYSADPEAGAKHWFGLNFESSAIRKRLTPFLAASQMLRQNLPECLDSATFDSLMIAPEQSATALSTDHQSSSKREYAGIFRNDTLTLNFKNGEMAVREADWNFFLGKGPFASDALKFTPKSSDEGYFLAVFALDGNDLPKSKRIRIYSHVEGTIQLGGNEVSRAVAVNRRLAPEVEIIPKNNLLKIERLEEILFIDVFRNE